MYSNHEFNLNVLMLTDIPILTGTILLAGLTLLAVSAGRRMLRWLRIDINNVVEHAVIAAGLGMGALQVIPFILFALGIGRPVAFHYALTILALSLLPDMWAVVRSGAKWMAKPRRRLWWEYLLGGTFLFLLGSIYVRAVCPATDIDALLYHITAAQRFLDEGGFVHLITITPTNWPLGAESLFAILLAVHKDAPISIIQFIFGVITIGTVYVYGKHLGGRFAGTAAVFLLFQWLFWWEMATGYVDVPLTALAGLMVYSLGRSEDHSVDGKWELLAAVFAGLAATIKIQGMLVIVTFVVLLLCQQKGKSGRERITSIALLACVSLAIVAPWYIRTWVLTGNPVYPMFYGVFGGHEWTAEGWTRYFESYLITDAISTGLPLTETVVYGTYALRIFIAWVIAYVIIRTTRTSANPTPLRFAAVFTACISTGSAFNTRFLLPTVPPLAVWMGHALLRWERPLKITLSFVAPILAVWISVSKVKPEFSLAASCAFGQITRHEYMKSNKGVIDYEVAEFSNAHLPPDSRILLSLEKEHTALYQHKTFWANYRLQDSFHYDNPDRLRSDLKRLGITHLVISNTLSDWYRTHPVWRVRLLFEMPALTEYAQKFGRKLFEANTVALYELNTSY